MVKSTNIETPQVEGYYCLLYHELPLTIIGPFKTNEEAASYGLGWMRVTKDPRWQTLFTYNLSDVSLIKDAADA